MENLILRFVDFVCERPFEPSPGCFFPVEFPTVVLQEGRGDFSKDGQRLGAMEVSDGTSYPPYVMLYPFL
jgi:hypothetical protein